MARITKKHRRVVRWYAFLAGSAVLAVISSFSVVFFRPLIYVYGIAILLYIVALAWSTGQVYRRYKGMRSALTMMLLPMQHLLYGFGFLKGLLAIRESK